MSTRDLLTAWINTLRTFGSDATDAELADEVITLIYGGGE